MKINRKGATRLVIELNNVVIKIPRPRIWNHFLRGILANINEKRTWKWNSGKYESGISYLICPVVWTSWGGWILIMKKAKACTLNDWELIDDITLHKKYFPGDDSISNYGWYKERLVKIDYGELDIYPSGMEPPDGKDKWQDLVKEKEDIA